MDPSSGGPRVLMGDVVLGKLVSETTVEIRNEHGLHMRPAMLFVDVASQFGCTISVSNGGESADGKSIMQMSILAAGPGTQLQIRAEGPDAEEAIKSLRELVEIRLFDEPPAKGNGNETQ